MSADDGTLKVVMPKLESDVQPTVNLIDAESLELVKTAVNQEEVPVPAGRYLLSATLPTGERSLAVAEVSAGEREEVELAPFEPPTRAEPAPAPPAALESLGPHPPRSTSGPPSRQSRGSSATAASARRASGRPSG